MAQEIVGHSADNYVTEEYLEELHAEMLGAAANLEFERAAQLRDRIAQLKGQPTAAPQVKMVAGRFFQPGSSQAERTRPWAFSTAAHDLSLARSARRSCPG